MDILFRPNRMKYVKETFSKKVPCVFCKNKGKGINFKTLILYEDSQSMVFLNKYPYNGGHLLVLPTRHTPSLLDLDEKEFSSLNVLVRKSIEIIKEVLSPDAMNIGVNMGTEAGAGIPDHLHYHIVPRWKGDTNFFPVISKSKVLPSDLETTYNKLSDKFK